MAADAHRPIQLTAWRCGRLVGKRGRQTREVNQTWVFQRKWRPITQRPILGGRRRLPSILSKALGNPAGGPVSAEHAASQGYSQSRKLPPHMISRRLLLSLQFLRCLSQLQKLLRGTPKTPLLRPHILVHHGRHLLRFPQTAKTYHHTTFRIPCRNQVFKLRSSTKTASRPSGPDEAHGTAHSPEENQVRERPTITQGNVK